MTRSKLWKQLLLCIQARTRRTPADLQGSRRALFISFFPTKTLKGQKGNSGKMNSKDAFDPPRPVRHPPSGPAKEGTWAEVPRRPDVPRGGSEEAKGRKEAAQGHRGVTTVTARALTARQTCVTWTGRNLVVPPSPGRGS